MNTTPQDRTAALTLIRDESVTVTDLAHHFGESETWAAGLLDAVTGDQDWSLMFDGSDIPQNERDDYQAGFRHGHALMEAEAYADGWRECYANAAAEELQAAELLPICDDCPF